MTGWKVKWFTELVLHHQLRDINVADKEGFDFHHDVARHPRTTKHCCAQIFRLADVLHCID